MLTYQNTTEGTSQGYFCTLFLLYQGKGEGPGAPHSMASVISDTVAGARRRSNRPARAADGPYLSLPPQEAPHLVLAPPLL